MNHLFRRVQVASCEATCTNRLLDTKPIVDEDEEHERHHEICNHYLLTKFLHGAVTFLESLLALNYSSTRVAGRVLRSLKATMFKIVYLRVG